MAMLEPYINFMESVEDFDLATIDQFIASDIHFVDPFNNTYGIDHYRRIIDDMRKQLETLKITVHERAMVGENSALIRWELSGKLRAFKGRDWCVEGCSRLGFNQHGQVSEHLDYWDAAGQLYESFPVLGSVLRRLRHKLATP